MAVIRLFAQVREAAGVARDELDGATVDEVLAAASARYGTGFAALLPTCKVWVNGEPAASLTWANSRITATGALVRPRPGARRPAGTPRRRRGCGGDGPSGSDSSRGNGWRSPAPAPGRIVPRSPGSVFRR